MTIKKAISTCTPRGAVANARQPRRRDAALGQNRKLRAPRRHFLGERRGVLRIAAARGITTTPMLGKASQTPSSAHRRIARSCKDSRALARAAARNTEDASSPQLGDELMP